MSGATYAIPNFLGGEISQFAQGRFDRPDYRVSLNVCSNGFPVEAGAWTRRPGTQFAGHTKGGVAGRVVKFDFEQSNAVTLELTDGALRFRDGPALATTNDSQLVTAISAANPAVVQVPAAATWATGDTLIFNSPSAPLLENRQFTATKIDSTHFSLTDALTGATIDGSAPLGALAAGTTVSRVQELATPYIGGLWSTLRAVQAETTDILLNAGVAPQALTVTTLPSAGVSPIFAINPAVFNDGPYLDPLTNGVQVTPSAKSGLISLTLSFPTYSATQAYAKGLFVTDGGVNYISLADQNVAHTPASSPLFWAPTSAGAAIGPNGFQGSDIGRLIRMFSEPPLWSVASTYSAGAVVTYNPSGAPGASTYWQSLTGSNTGHPPGADLTNWSLLTQNAAIWTWGRIVSLSNLIDRALAGSTSIGDMIASGGGINAVFNGNFSQASAASANGAVIGGFLPPGGNVTLISYVGKNYGATPQAIQQATVYPSSDKGFASGSYTSGHAGVGVFSTSIVFILRGNSVAPASASDGTLLAVSPSTPNTFSSVTLISNDQVTTWKYVWIEIIVNTSSLPSGASSYTVTSIIAQVSFFAPTGPSTGTGVELEVLGPALLYTNSILTWRLGAYSDTTGWPTCGAYFEGRLWLGGAVANRFDTSVSNGILGGTVNFAPTDQYGVVAASSAISETLNSDSVNPIFWMEPDLQGIILGTQAGEYLVQAPTTGPMSPINIAARRVTKIGCANVEPRRTEHTTVFAQRYRKKLVEYFPDVYSGKFTAPNIAEKAEHIAGRFIAELAYTSAVTPVIWGRCDDGSLFGVTYKRDTLTTAQGPTFAGWHRHTLGSGRTVESICAGPSVGGDLDALTMVTNDPATGIRHVEILTDTPDENTPLSSAWFLDDAVVPTSTVQRSGGDVGGAEAEAFLARTSGLNATHRIAYIALIDGLVADGLWPKLDMLHVYATQDSTTALLNLVSTSYNGTSNGSPTFTVDRGFTGVDFSGTVYIDTAFNPSTAISPKFVQDSAHISGWNLSNITDIFPFMGSTLTTPSYSTDLFPKYVDGNAEFFCNGAAIAVANADARGHHVANRSASNATEGYRNGASVVTGSPVSAAVGNQTITTLSEHKNGAHNGAANQMAMASIGSSLSAGEVTLFYNRLRTYMTAVGVP